MIKRITLALAALGFTSVVFAGTAEEMPLPVSQDINLTAPEQDGYFTVGAEALYWMPNNSNFQYAGGVSAPGTLPIGPNPFTNTLSRSYQYDVGDDYAWGYRADLTYHMPGYGRDISVSFTHLNSSDASSVVSTPSTDALIFFSPVIADPAENIWLSAAGKAQTDYNAVDLTTGQKINAGTRITIHPFLGIRYADMSETDTAFYGLQVAQTVVIPQLDNLTVIVNANNSYATQMKDDYWGVGPRFGSDAEIHLTDSFHVVGRVGLSLLAGDLDRSAYTSFSYNTTTTPNFPPLNGTTEGTIINNYADSTRLVPEADARLGGRYDYHFSGNNTLSLEAGYEITNYFDVFDHSVLSGTDTTDHNTDFGMQGPYVRLAVDFG